MPSQRYDTPRAAPPDGRAASGSASGGAASAGRGETENAAEFARRAGARGIPVAADLDLLRLLLAAGANGEFPEDLVALTIVVLGSLGEFVERLAPGTIVSALAPPDR